MVEPISTRLATSDAETIIVPVEHRSMTLRRNPASEGRVEVDLGGAIKGAHLAKHTIHDDDEADVYDADDTDAFDDEASFGTSEIEAELEAAMEYMIASEGMTGVNRIFELVNDVLRRRL